MTDWKNALEKANEALRCGAKTRQGSRCQSPAMKNGRCRMHGGSSPGAPCGERHGRFKYGLHTKQAKVRREEIKHLLHIAKSLSQQVIEQH